jgi:hypothetical protein
VYTIAVELFPVAPAEGAAFPYMSSLRTSTELYVSAARRVPSLGPASSYWMLYDFDGSLRDAAPGGIDAEPLGAVEAAAAADTPGYRIADASGIRIARSAVPEGPLEGFTLSLGLTLSEAAPGARILTSQSGGRLLILELGPDGAPLARLSSETGEETLASGVAALRAGDRHHIDLTFVRVDTRLAAMWFLDGEPGAVTPVLDEGRLPAGPGQTLLGGPQGIAGLIDELGVYYRDAEGRSGPDPGVYNRAMTLRYGDALLLADGFDGAWLGQGYQTEGEASVDLGRLVLEGGSRVGIPLQGPRSGDLMLEVVADRELELGWEGATLKLSAGAPRAAERSARFRVPPRTGEAAAGGYRLALVNDSADRTLSVASLLAYTE